MFTIDTKITGRDVKKKDLLKVLHSMNNHQVATPETSLEEARSYVFFAREGKNKLSAYIGLHLIHTDRKLFYVYSENPFLEEELQEVEDEARYFAEDLGAMLDEVNFANLSRTEQHRWIEGQSIFSQKKQTEAATEEQSPEPESEVSAEPQRPSTAPEEDQPEPESAVSAATAQPLTTSQRSAPAVETIPAAEPPAAPVQPVIQEDHPEEQEHTPQQIPADGQIKASPLATAKRRQETTQKKEMSGVENTPKQTEKRKMVSATGVVSRDREALARLLTSF